MGQGHLMATATAATAAALLGFAVTPAAADEPAPGTTRETPVHSTAPDADVVVASYVRLYEPLPAEAGAHPKRCDWIGYLRFRAVDGPSDPQRADAVFVGMPGIFGGASSLEQIGRNLVRTAHLGGDAVEFWALDRRSNCLEDHHGTEAAARAQDYQKAFDYYWGGQRVGGESFDGWKSPMDAAFLSEVGLEQTMRDEYAVIRNGIPKPSVRRQRVFCGGHSLGGPLTTAFAGWDFDGDPETKDDAGFRQCAGLFGLDTSLGFSDGEPGFGVGALIGEAGEASPYLNLPPFTPETIQLVTILGIGSYYDPHGTSMIDDMPHSTNIDGSQRALFSRDAVNFVTQDPSIRDFEMTNQTALAGVFDDNSNPVTILRASLGTIDGGAVAEKDFPAPGYTPFEAPLVNNDYTSIPSEPEGPLYRWRDYDRMNAPGADEQRNDAGDPYTSAASEVTDVKQFSRALFEPPADYTEYYFPTQIVVDVGAAGEGDRGGDLSNIRYDGVAKRPGLLIQAGDSAKNSGAEPSEGGEGTPPSDDPLSGELILPGYNHLDVASAARRQNDGSIEAGHRALLRFGLAVTKRG